ncbi:fungal-specific transcription factor domain-containing protein [Limtongia smithiae]|uniref:fungal-specific transcription factor domain-containing protein n=1 Tax=Limtongia smithiae TaxID=1125753 RepID=UPI0034CD1243
MSDKRPAAAISDSGSPPPPVAAAATAAIAPDSRRPDLVAAKGPEKKFKCLHPGCGKTFNRKDYLARHAANHLEVRPYQCPICPSQFARQDLLEKHLSTKTHEKRQKREALDRLGARLPRDASGPYATPSYDHQDAQAGPQPPQQQQQQQQQQQLPPPPMLSLPGIAQSAPLRHQSSSPRSVSDYALPPPQHHHHQLYAPPPPLHYPPPPMQPGSGAPSPGGSYGLGPGAVPLPQALQSPLLPHHGVANTPTPSPLPSMVPSHQQQAYASQMHANSPRLTSGAPSPAAVPSVGTPPALSSLLHQPHISGAPPPSDNSPRSLPLKLLYDDPSGDAKPTIKQISAPHGDVYYHTSTDPSAYSRLPLPLHQSPLSSLPRISSTGRSGTNTPSPAAIVSQSLQLPMPSSQQQPQPVPPQHPQQQEQSSLPPPSQPPPQSSAVAVVEAPSLEVPAHDMQYGLPYGDGPEWAPFALDSFDLSLSDHYAWLFGSDFWSSESSHESLLSTQAPVVINNPDHNWSQPRDYSHGEKSARSSRRSSDLFTSSIVAPNYGLQQQQQPLSQMRSSTDRVGMHRRAPRSDYTSLGLLRQKSISTVDPEMTATIPVNHGSSDNSNVSRTTESTALSRNSSDIGSVIPVSANDSSLRTFPESDTRSPSLLRKQSESRMKKDDKDISDEVHANMIRVLEPIREITFDNPYFSLAAVKQYLNLYWVHFDPLYPILHRATFDPSVMEPVLIVAIVTIGMAYSTDREASDLAILIHRKFRNIVFLMIEDQPQVQLWVHQTLLLTNYFDKMLGSTVQYDMSQFFHGTNIALMHFSGYLKGLIEPSVVDTSDSVLLDQQWREWVVFETTKRTAFFAFICDTQHATLFRHSPILSAFEVRLELPSTDACWAAVDGVEFYQMYNQQCKVAEAGIQFRSNDSQQPGKFNGHSNQETLWPSFLHSLKRLIRLSNEDQKQFQLATFSQFSCLILLHGLLSICWDMQSRGLLDMGIVSKRRMTEFKNRLESSFDNWKGYFDYQLSKSNLPTITSAVMYPADQSPRTSSTPGSVYTDGSHDAGSSVLSQSPLGTVLMGTMNDYNTNSPMLCSNWAMFQLGLMALHVDTMNLRINAGSPNVLGRKIHPVDRENCNKAVHQWARSEDGRLATWHSLQFMRRITENEGLLDQAVHIPWGVYLATLTIWSFEVCHRDETVPPPGSGHRHFTRNNARYWSVNGRTIEYSLAKQDAIKYLRSMCDLGQENLGEIGSRTGAAGPGATDAVSTAAADVSQSGSNVSGSSLPRPSTTITSTTTAQQSGKDGASSQATATGGRGSSKAPVGDRKQLVIGLIAFSTAVLMPIKWGFVLRGYEVLNNILKEYD